MDLRCSGPPSPSGSPSQRLGRSQSALVLSVDSEHSCSRSVLCLPLQALTASGWYRNRLRRSSTPCRWLASSYWDWDGSSSALTSPCGGRLRHSAPAPWAPPRPSLGLSLPANHTIPERSLTSGD